MRPLLMYADKAFEPDRPPAWNEEALVQDLGLGRLLETMAQGDKFLLGVARCALLRSPQMDVDAIRYRQAILADCLGNAQTVRAIYDLAVTTIEREKRDYWSLFARHPEMILSRSRNVMEMLLGALRALRRQVYEEAGNFSSAGFTAFFAMLRRELSNSYLAEVEDHLVRLRFARGITLSANLAPGNHVSGFVLRMPKQESASWLRRIFARESSTYAFSIHPRDEAGAHILADLRDRGVNLVANALAQSVDHVVDFFKALRTELAFYLACINLHEHLSAVHASLCVPVPKPPQARDLTFRGLCDVSLSLALGRAAVGSDLNGAEKSLVIVTGANQGGKTTYLRSLGQAQLMMQAGLFVAANAFSANICAGLATHFKREEDAAMASGKLDEELARMSDIIDQAAPDSLILFNESFAATNEREGSQLARQIIDALLSERVKIAFVTHLYELAHTLWERAIKEAVFVRAERLADGTRTYRIVAGEPLDTSFGADVYRQVFGPQPDAPAAAEGQA